MTSNMRESLEFTLKYLTKVLLIQGIPELKDMLFKIDLENCKYGG